MASRDTRPFVKTRTLVNLPNVLSLFGQNTMMCVDLGTLQIIRQLLERASWPTTYYNELIDNHYTLPTDSEMDIIDEKLGEFYLESDKAMALCEDLITRIDTLTGVIAEQQLCCPEPGGGGGFFADEPVPTYGTQGQTPPANWEPGFYSPGSSEYFDRKCRAANYILDGLDSILLEFAGTDIGSVGTTLGLGIAAGMVLAILSAPVAGPFAVAIGVIGAIAAGVSLFVAGGINFVNLRSYLSANRGTMICSLFESTSAATAVDDLIADFDTAGATAVEKTFLRWLFDYSGATNTLFFSRPDIPALPTEVSDDCSACAQNCPEYNITLGTFVSDVSDVVTIDSVFVPGLNGGHFINVHFGQDTISGGACGPVSTIKITSISQSSNEPALKAYRRCDTAFLGAAGPANPQWTELVNDWSGKINVTDTGVRTLCLYKKGTTQFTATVEVT